MTYVRRTLALAVVGLVLAFAPIGSSAAQGAATSHKTVALLSCTGSTVVRPSTFVITCADGNVELTATRWMSWGSTSAHGTTRFGLNSCTPYCAASPISFYAKSSVELLAPRATRRGPLFSLLEVTYYVRGTAKHYRFSWVGDPAFSH